MVGSVLSQLKPSSTFLALKIASIFFKAKNVEFLGLYPVQNSHKLVPTCKKT